MLIYLAYQLALLKNLYFTQLLTPINTGTNKKKAINPQKSIVLLLTLIS